MPSCSCSTKRKHLSGTTWRILPDLAMLDKELRREEEESATDAVLAQQATAPELEPTVPVATEEPAQNLTAQPNFMSRTRYKR